MLSMLITLIVIIFDIFAIADILKSSRDTATKVILRLLPKAWMSGTPGRRKAGAART